MRHLPSLADRILAVLPSFDVAPMARDVATRLHTDEPHVRQAFERLESEGRARIVRRGRALHLVPADYPGRICIICRTEVPLGRRKETRTCSHSCARHLAWQNPDMRARHKASVIASRQKPGFKEALTKRWRDHYAKPESRQKASEAQIKTWQDPTIKGRRLVSIENAWKGEQAHDRREKASKKKLSLWSDPEWRQATINAMRTGRRGQVKRRTIELAKAHPEMTPAEIAAWLSCKVERIVAILRKARNEGVIGIRPGDGPRLRRKAERQIAA